MKLNFYNRKYLLKLENFIGKELPSNRSQIFYMQGIMNKMRRIIFIFLDSFCFNQFKIGKSRIY